MKTSLKTSHTVKEYKVRAFGYDIVVPEGSRVSNRTACGPDDNYRFWVGWNSAVVALTGYMNSILAHDLTYYGLNIPADYCVPYSEVQK
jgi:hypothetical protein